MHALLAVTVADVAVPMVTGLATGAAAYAFATRRQKERPLDGPLVADATRVTLAVRPTRGLHTYAPAGSEVMVSARCSACQTGPLFVATGGTAEPTKDTYYSLVVPQRYNYETSATFALTAKHKKSHRPEIEVRAADSAQLVLMVRLDHDRLFSRIRGIGLMR